MNEPFALAVVGILFIGCLTLAILWLRSRARYRTLHETQSESEWVRIDHDLALAEQSGRLGIIRELQDVAIQSVTEMIAQAEGARYSGERDPQSAVRAAGALAQRGKSALGDLRRVMTIVSEGEAVAAPQPSLASARELFSVMREAGLIVTFTEAGEQFLLQPGAELAVIRIVQSALQNALTHGGAETTVDVKFSWSTTGVQVSVDDDGIRARARAAGATGEALAAQTRYTINDDLRSLTERVDGAAITAMRERALLYGGVLSARSVPGIGFSVTASFPNVRFHNGVHAVNLAR